MLKLVTVGSRNKMIREENYIKSKVTQNVFYYYYATDKILRNW